MYSSCTASGAGMTMPYFIREVNQSLVILGPAIVDFAKLVRVDITRLTGPTSKNLRLATRILLLQHRVWTPDDPHTGTTACLNTGDGGLEDGTLL
jgi:hypothetical protein